MAAIEVGTEREAEDFVPVAASPGQSELRPSEERY